MPKCPYCGSTAHPILTNTQLTEDGWTITAQRQYFCACGCQFETESIYTCDGCEIVVFSIEPTPGDTPNCPKCGRALEEYECYDTVSTDTGIANLWTGSCPTCGTGYSWRENYSFNGFDEIEECH